jgi:hypothetical protein
MTTEICILCGHVICADVGRRYKKYDAMTDLVIAKCIPTSFVYSSVIKYHGENGKHTVCIACVNWTRRLSLKKEVDLVFIPMDNLILFVINPGKYPEPDKRTLVRLLRSLSMPVKRIDGMTMFNHYVCFQQGCMQSLQRFLMENYFTEEINEDDVTEKDCIVDAIVRQWWIFNGMPVFIDEKRNGRYVRRMLRTHRVLSLPSSIEYKKQSTEDMSMG